MKCTETVEKTAADSRSESVILMPLGMLGFEQYKRYSLRIDPNEEPFIWLQVVEEPRLAFLAISPFSILPTYKPELSGDDTRFLGLEAADDAFVLNVVTLRGSQPPTVNLKGPIVLNRRTLMAKQVIPMNAPELPVAYPLPMQAE